MSTIFFDDTASLSRRFASSCIFAGALLAMTKDSPDITFQGKRKPSKANARRNREEVGVAFSWK
jgi:hypothetical protein